MDKMWESGPEFPEFRDLILEDKPLFDQLLSQSPPVISEFTFTNLFIWQNCYQTKMSLFQKLLCLLSDRGEASFFFPPIAEGDVVECYRSLLRYLKEKGSNPKIARVPETVVVNREQDLGEEGLRKAKESYFPHHMVNKYRITLE